MSAQGKFAWYELLTTDTAAAGSFYSSVVGWSTHSVGSPEMPYTTFNLGPTGIAGMLTLPKEASAMGQPPSWIGYIHVDDVDAYVAKVVAAGGAIQKPATDVPGMLRFAVVADPQGVSFVLFTGNPAMPTPPKPAAGSPGTIGWHELMAVDGAAAFAFYSSQYGWSKTRDFDMGPMGNYLLFAIDGVETGGMMTKPPNLPAAFWSFYFNVDAIGAAIERIKAGGGNVVNGPMQVPGGQWIVQATDPQGAFFALVSYNA